MKIKRITTAGTADVYNMEVDDTHDYAIENGVIVHNCRYVLMENPISPRIPQKVEPRRLSPLDTEHVHVFNR